MTDKCVKGQQLWADAHRGGMTNDARIVAWIAYQDHWLNCQQCNRHRAEQWQKAANAPVYDFDLEVEK
jgi:hypothetical protein